MAFSKTFPRKVMENAPPVWEEIRLSDEEEQQVEEECRRANFQLLDECLEEAKSLGIKHRINTDENQVSLAIALFEKRASHVVFWKESKTKEKFDKQYK
ncbi:hypothetical protein COV20_05225 [Candidatus Woesearchaeota archaeon CG10_big_fil_rev_8_21_14_0_10_45_16]|nr:MAG: hypothetical protein COV20_05225 [Candidatus Woesearchaeota archaeon CG10_big_fil_rev_8_21_14_0_10_45_16]